MTRRREETHLQMLHHAIEQNMDTWAKELFKQLLSERPNCLLYHYWFYLKFKKDWNRIVETGTQTRMVYNPSVSDQFFRCFEKQIEERPSFSKTTLQFAKALNWMSEKKSADSLRTLNQIRVQSNRDRALVYYLRGASNRSSQTKENLKKSLAAWRWFMPSTLLLTRIELFYGQHRKVQRFLDALGQPTRQSRLWNWRFTAEMNTLAVLVTFVDFFKKAFEQVQAGMYRVALTNSLKAFDIFPESAFNIRLLLHLALRIKALEIIPAKLEKVKVPNVREYGLALFEYYSDNLPSASKRIEKIAEDSYLYQSLAGSISLDQGRTKAAKKWYTAAIESNSDFLPARRGLLSIAFDEGRFEEALSLTLDMNHVEDSIDAPSLFDLPILLNDLPIMGARAALKCGKLDEAEKLLKRIPDKNLFRFNQIEIRSRVLLARGHSRQASRILLAEFQQEGLSFAKFLAQHQDLVQAVLKCLKEDATEFLLLKGVMLLEAGDVEEALPILNCLHEKQEGHSQVMFHLGRGLIRAGKDKEGTNVLMKIIHNQHWGNPRQRGPSGDLPQAGKI